MSAAPSQPSSSYARRRIEVTLQLGPAFDAQSKPIPHPTFAESNGADTVTLSGLRCSAEITKAGGVAQGALDLRVYGMSQSLMNQASGTIRGLPYVLKPNNIVTVKAGTDATGLAVAYQGTISDAWANYDGAPDVFFHVLGLAAYDAALTSVPPSSYKGNADVAVVMADLARLMGMNFENSGVSGIILSNPYFPGTAYQQAEACREAAGINMFVDDGGGGGSQRTLAIWPRGGSRGGAVPLISSDTGLVGYPRITNVGVDVRTLYNPAVSFGAKVEVKSPTAPQANGIWQVKQLEHLLESETPDGAWFSQLSCTVPGFIA